MKTYIEPKLAENKVLKGIVEAASPILEHGIGEPASRVTATWSLESDNRSRPLLRLTLSDWAGKATGDFAPEELQPPERAYRRFYRLWGDLLQEVAQRKIQELEALVTSDEDA